MSDGLQYTDLSIRPQLPETLKIYCVKARPPAGTSYASCHIIRFINNIFPLLLITLAFADLRLQII